MATASAISSVYDRRAKSFVVKFVFVFWTQALLAQTYMHFARTCARISRLQFKPPNLVRPNDRTSRLLKPLTMPVTPIAKKNFSNRPIIAGRGGEYLLGGSHPFGGSAFRIYFRDKRTSRDFFRR